MNLPEFFACLNPIHEVLMAMEEELIRLAEAAAEENAQLHVMTAERDLSRWRKDLSLPAAGDPAADRIQIRAALAGGQTLTRKRLAELAVTVGGADRSTVKEDFSASYVTVYVLYEGRKPEYVSVLAEGLERHRPSHLTVEVLPAMVFRGMREEEYTLYGKAHLNLRGLAERE